MSEIHTVYVVFKTHFDIGYTDLAAEVINRYGKKMLPDVIKTCEETQVLGQDHRFIWTMSAWPLLQTISSANAAPEDIERAKGLIHSGQLAWHLLPYTTHTEFCGLEEFIRGFRFSRCLSKEHGYWPVSAKMTDVPGHTWILPTLLNKAGVKFLHLGCNPGCMPPDVPKLFFWEGPDGSRVLTFYSKGSYGSSLIPPEDWPFPVWLALMQTNDNIGPQGPDAVQTILDGVRKQLPAATVKTATMDDFYHALSQYPLDHLPVVRADLADSWIHGVGTYPLEVSSLRASRMLLLETEKAYCLANALKALSDRTAYAIEASLAAAYEQSLLFGEHTWGLCVETALKHRYYSKNEFLAHKRDKDVLHIEDSWNEQRARAELSLREIRKIVPTVMDALASNVATDGRRLVVFNGLGWSRNAWVDAESLNLKAEETVVDVKNHKALQTVWVDERPMVYVPDLPEFGYMTLAPVATASAPLQKTILCDAGAGTIENKWFTVKADAATGSILSLVDKETGREWVDHNAGYGLGQYRYDIYGIEDITEFIRSYAYRFSDWLINDLGRQDYPEIGHHTYYARDFSISCVANGMCSSLVLKAAISGCSTEEYGNAEELETRITLYENEPCIDLAVCLHRKQETPYIEAGHIVMPLNLKDHHVRINKLGCVLDPLSDIVRDANHGLYCCENWVDLYDDQYGIAVIPMDMPLFSLGDQAINQYRRDPSPKQAELYFNLFNTSWGTNFPQWIGGEFTYRYRLIPHKGDWREGRIQQKALECMAPVITGLSDGCRGVLPPTKSFIKAPEGAAVLALKPVYDGDGYILRLRELDGMGTDCPPVIDQPFACAGECDLLERIIGNTAEGGASKTQANQFDIRTLLLKQTNP